MTFRADILVDWSTSPRLIWVAAPSTECTMQDLYDTLRTLEAGSPAMDEPPIVSAGGKEDLGGGEYVGLTVTLLNAQVAFEARPGPTWVQCILNGGNLVAQDENGLTIASTYPTAYVSITLEKSSSPTLSESTQLQDIHAAHMNRRTRNTGTGEEIIYEADGTTPRHAFDTTDDGSQITEINPQ